MPKREDLKKIMIIGAGPIIIGQACEFDYSGTQAVKALKEEGYEVVLVNSNPATIMTDPELADRTYIEPITVEACTKIIEKEKPCALLPTLGGQTALNAAIGLHEAGVLDKHNIELIGANIEAINKAEDRDLFKQAMDKIGLNMPKGQFVHTFEEAMQAFEEIGTPTILRPSFTMGGTGGGIAYNREEYETIVRRGLDESPTNEVLVEQSIIGWKEYEMEVMRDLNDNVVIICSIENFDPMGVHTGDSFTVAPAQTLSDVEYQIMRDASVAVIREIGVDTGGSNIQFALNPANGEMTIIEMNPRVSRSSALASKATGFPIAKIAAKLAVGYSLDELPNDITKMTPASFEPTLDYVVTKVPRFTFEKFPQADATLTTQMKSVGEVMAIGRTFKESMQKAFRGLETSHIGLGCEDKTLEGVDRLKSKLVIPTAERIFYIKYALENNLKTVEEIHNITKVDPWFLNNILDLVTFENESLKGKNLNDIDADTMFEAKQLGYSDAQIAFATSSTELEVRDYRKAQRVTPIYKAVDTCSAEFEAFTPYFYSSYDEENEAIRNDKRKIIILGGGPNRIGQGIEFDYCCVHASFALKEENIESIMVNSNPETVSTDYDTSDKLYFEPLTFEDVMNIVENEKPEGVIVQFGGQTPLSLSVALEKAGVKILGTSSDSIDRTENRERFGEVLDKLGLTAPEYGTAVTKEEAVEIADRIGFPVLVRPSYVLGGRAMAIVYNASDLIEYMNTVGALASADRPILVDKFLQGAVEVDVDAICDGDITVVAGIMQHIEEAGIHSGDSAAILPPQSISQPMIDEMIRQTKALAIELGVVGMMNIQYAIKDEQVYLIEVNPRASRTVPFVSKATGVPLARLATKILSGKTLTELGFTERIVPKYVSVKESVFPFNKFPEVDPVLSPEMKSTGEVMGLDDDFGISFAKSQMAAGARIPTKGKVFISVADMDKTDVLIGLSTSLKDNGFEIVSTSGTARFLKENGLEVSEINKVSDGHPHIIDAVTNGEISLMINTPVGMLAKEDDQIIRTSAIKFKVAYTTTLTGADATVKAISSLKKNKGYDVKCLQDYFV